MKEYKGKIFINLTGYVLITEDGEIFTVTHPTAYIEMLHSNISNACALYNGLEIKNLPEPKTFNDKTVFYIVDNPLIMLVETGRNDIVVPSYQQFNNATTQKHRRINGFVINLTNTEV